MKALDFYWRNAPAGPHLQRYIRAAPDFTPVTLTASDAALAPSEFTANILY
jgi:hypothetical protein